ncbi:MAG: glycosyltransferase family 4 protein [Candidatus Magasanikbacteria bacterium]|nr:glycosyltransferase family 4 protein [Candidatus Magasanikbacteria bacterium]
MKILILTLEYPPQVGGIASYVYNLAAHLPAAEVIVYAPQLAGSEKFDQSCPWRVYRARQGWPLWPRWLPELWQVWRLVRRERPGQLFVHQALPLGYAAWFIRWWYKLPYTVFLHGTDVGHASRPGKRWQFRRVIGAAARIVVNSEFLQAKLASQFDSLPRVVVLHPAPGSHFFSPAPVEERYLIRSRLGLAGKKVILTVGRLAEGKGYPQLLRLLPEIVRQVPSAVLLIIGSGPKEETLKGIIQQYEAQNLVRFLGAVPYALLPVYYQIADLFILLTHPDVDTEEGWGTVFLEAAAAGLPVVAGRAGGVEEAVVDGVTGKIVEVNQPSRIISAAVELLQNPELARQLGEAGRARAAQEFRWEETVKKLL